MDRPRVVLDACVLFPFYLRDFLLRLSLMSEEWVYLPFWSVRILDEVRLNIMEKKPHVSKKAIQNTIVLMNKAFPDACVDYEKYLPIAENISLPDRNDLHVVAAALAAKAELILTFNGSDFPNKHLEKIGVAAMLPQNFILDLMLTHKVEINPEFR